jgi:hypothetical protein
MEALVVILGLLGLAKGGQPQAQQVQTFYNPQNGKYYFTHNGYLYEQNIPQNQGYQNQPTQNLATPNWTPQPPNGQWYPQQPAQTATYPQGFYR